MMKLMTGDELLKRLEAVEAYVDDERPKLQAQIASLTLQLTAPPSVSKASPLIEAIQQVVNARVATILAEGQTHTTKQAGSYTLEKVSTTVRLEETSRERKYSDDTIQGKVLRIINEGKPGAKWSIGELYGELTRRWGEVTDKKVLGNELRNLCKEKPPPLTRIDQGNSTWMYFVPEGTTLVKETAK